MNEQAIYYFHQGTSIKAYEYLGAHFEGDSVVFRVWAPNAKYVSVVGDFNNWDLNKNPMKRINNEGIYECYVENIKEFDVYQYAITTKRGKLLYKSDPYAFHAELRPGKLSKVYNLEGYTFHDEEWMKNKCNVQRYDKPLSIYELHLGSWKHHLDGNSYSYIDLANNLVEYLKEMHYTHVEIMPVSEYPYDPSWGYQVTGFYAITSRYGTPKDFMQFVDILHQAGFGVIVDWVPGHFNKDANGLIEFDGKCLYEPSNNFRKEHKSWGTRCFDYGRCEIQSFLVSNAIFYLDKFHIDGLRTDAVSSMLFLNYDRKDGEWEPNTFGTNENLDAIAFIKKVNKAIKTFDPYALVIAEEASSYPLITCPVEYGGLGYDYKWNMGWMNDTLRYIGIDPYFKGDHSNLISFQLTYAFSEHYILPISHDEVVHLKKSLLSKMPGSYDDKFAHLKTYLTYMYTHPGKKLLFMGQDMGEFDEWNELKELDWTLLNYPKHQELRKYVSTLNELYQESAPLYDDTLGWNGFNWLVVEDKEHAVFAYKRMKDNDEFIIILNFSNVEHHDYNLNIQGEYEVVLCSEEKTFGGYVLYQGQILKAINNLTITIPAHSGMILKKGIIEEDV